MPITSTHPDYDDMQARWQRCRDVAGGSDKVKAAGTEYLPRPPGMRLTDGSYSAYVMRALFYNAMARTVDGLAGMVMQKEPDVEVPPAIEDLLGDVTLADEPLEGFALEVLEDVLTVGRSVVLVDYSSASGRPYLCRYAAEDLVSWRTERIDGDPVLVRAVLAEQVTEAEDDDLSRITTTKRYRELLLDGDGEYRLRLHVKMPGAHLRDPTVTRWIAGDWMTPARRGEALPFIPMVVVNSSALGLDVERPPLVDLADVNLSHYRSSADRKHALYYVSMPTPWVAGAKGDGPLKIGGDAAWQLDEGGRAGMLEHSGEGIGAIQEMMAEEQELMASLGARLLETQPQGDETATAVRMRHSGEHASLRTIANVVSAGLAKALELAAWWEGTENTPADTGVTFALNRDFLNIRMGADELRAAVMAYQAGAFGFDTLYHNLKAGEWTRPGVDADDERAALTREGLAALTTE